MIQCPILGTFTCFQSFQDKTLMWKEKRNIFFYLETASSLIYFLVNKNAYMKKGEC